VIHDRAEDGAMSAREGPTISVPMAALGAEAPGRAGLRRRKAEGAAARWRALRRRVAM